MPQNSDFCICRFFWPLTDDYDGDVDLKFEFHAEDPAKDKRPTAFDGRQSGFWSFSQKAFRADSTVFGAKGPKNRLFGCPKCKNTFVF